ncbi:MAG: bifunctional demethylmenaquinone methyltransferase/2-methoxy-6-polyprenyl-1,4-benzoquinol methylase UbiE [Candidatus Omnitrophica bacterium]|nr:bifunctional demethylmenaquinone methyltransferase/2-methoxy-6-polyprenyl-1,4-benzoquinol methylase UbiE [Candidatus Omnitrophota bacterium]
MTQNSSFLFSSIACRYDLLNRILSCGMDRGWRQKTAASVSLPQGSRILDVCTGTADLALSFWKKHPHSRITGIDLSDAMLDIARKKINARRARPQVFLGKADALSLPFEDRSFDATATAFGIRNLSDHRKGLLEMKRVTKNKGHILVLEFVPPKKNLISSLVRFYIKQIIPRAGGWISRSPAAYAHLSSSIMSFLTPERVCGMMKQIGLNDISVRHLNGGIACIYQARTP